MSEKKVVYYSEFGAVGDGVAEDFPAIVKCHEYANANGCTVKADPGAVYYIRETGEPAIILTDVDWGDATFILDDAKIPVSSPSRTCGIFRILREHPVRKFEKDSDVVRAINEKGGLKADDFTNVGYAPGYPCLLIIHDTENGAYNRWGCHATGTPNPQRELVIVDAEGNVDPETRLLLDYKSVTAIEEYRIDDSPLTVQNGKFITKANCAPPVYTAYSRGIRIERSNVTLRGIVHEVTEEGPLGAPYSAFVGHYAANNVRLEELSLQSHKSYKDYEYDENGKVVKIHSVMGSYDIGGSFGNNIVYYKCIQTNFYKYEEKNITYNENERWGIMGSNYNKNITFDSSVLSRFDAHAGIYNVVIKNTKISYIKLIGGGKAVIENSTVIAPEGLAIPLIELRPDYGSTWRGEIIIKDTEFINWTHPNVYIIGGVWNNWAFGYNSSLPSITLDNLKIDKPTDRIYVYPKFVADTSVKIDEPVLDGGKENLNPMFISPTLTVKNNNGGYKITPSENPYIASKIKMH